MPIGIFFPKRTEVEESRYNAMVQATSWHVGNRCKPVEPFLAPLNPKIRNRKKKRRRKTIGICLEIELLTHWSLEETNTGRGRRYLYGRRRPPSVCRRNDSPTLPSLVARGPQPKRLSTTYFSSAPPTLGWSRSLGLLAPSVSVSGQVGCSTGVQECHDGHVRSEEGTHHTHSHTHKLTYAAPTLTHEARHRRKRNRKRIMEPHLPCERSYLSPSRPLRDAHSSERLEEKLKQSEKRNKQVLEMQLLSAFSFTTWT